MSGSFVMEAAKSMSGKASEGSLYDFERWKSFWRYVFISRKLSVAFFLCVSSYWLLVLLLKFSCTRQRPQIFFKLDLKIRFVKTQSTNGLLYFLVCIILDFKSGSVVARFMDGLQLDDVQIYLCINFKRYKSS